MKLNYCLLAIAVICGSGCKKIQDHYSDILHGKPATCKLTEIRNAITDPTANVTYLCELTYNSWGYPNSTTFTNYDLLSADDFVYTFNFAYDSRKRIQSLTSDFVYYGGLHYYGYNGNSLLPVRDTIPDVMGAYEVNDLERDGFGRVVKITTRHGWYIPDDSYPIYETTVKSYYYDQNGNRQENPSNANYPGLIKYSNKPSLYSLHPVWEIVYHNSSRNLPEILAEYNNKGYPTFVLGLTPANWTPFLIAQDNSNLHYECKK